MTSTDSAGSHSHTNTALDAALSNEIGRATTAEAALAARVAKLEAAAVPVPPPVPTPPPIVLPFPGFQQAHDAAVPGATILLPAGTTVQAPTPFTSTKQGLIWQGQTGTVIDQSKVPLAQQQAAITFLGAATQLLLARLTGAAVDGLAIHAPGCKATDVEIDHAGDLGIGVGVQSGGASQGDSFTWLRGSIHDCNPLWTPATDASSHSGGNVGPFNPGWEAGGMKIIPGIKGLTVDGLEVYGNGGPGVWSDTNHGPLAGIVIRNLRGHDQLHPAIMVETTDGAEITGCTVWECGWWLARPGFDFWSAGILVSSSGHIVIDSNLVAWCPSSVIFASQAAPGGTTPRDGLATIGNSATGNIFAQSAGRQTVRVSVDWPSPYASPVAIPNAVATAAQLTAAGVPTAPQAGH